MRRPVDIWHKPALSAVVALAIPDFTLFALGRMDLVLYTSAGAMCALYGHGLPYAARARALPWVVIGMVASLAVALTAASLVSSAVVLVALASVLAAVHKVVCDATRIGPPGNLIFTFIAASAFFVPQRISQVPLHLVLALAAGAVAWLVGMAPALVRPRGPERIATARALEAAATLLRAEAAARDAAPGEAEGAVVRARQATATAVNAAWHTVFLVPARTPAKAEARAGLERLLIRAEAVLGGAADGHNGRDEADGHIGRDESWPRHTGGSRLMETASALPSGTAPSAPSAPATSPYPFPSTHTDADAAPSGSTPPSPSPEPSPRPAIPTPFPIAIPAPSASAVMLAEAEMFGGWAREVRGGGPLPVVVLTSSQRAELVGVEVDRRQVEERAEDRGEGYRGDQRIVSGTGRGIGVDRCVDLNRTRVDVNRARAGEPGTGRLPEGLGEAAAEEAAVGSACRVGGTTHNMAADPRDAAVACASSRYGTRCPAPGRVRGWRVVGSAFRAGSPLLPVGLRTAVGCALAGWASMLLGVGHPYWAVVTAASVFQANTTLSWQRALQRSVGNLLGLVVFTALLPLIHTGHLAMIALALFFQFGAEAWITRNYWLGSVCVTPMALLLTEFGNPLPARVLVADRWIDTVVGAALGLVCCVLVTNRRAGDRIGAALERTAAAQVAAGRLLAADAVPGAVHARETGWARDRLAGALAELREAVDVASGEWWQRALPEERVARAEQHGHRTLALLARRLAGAAPAVRPVPEPVAAAGTIDGVRR
ncbi:hypothetical protein GCM10017688_00530 [Streptomyces ramulosus]